MSSRAIRILVLTFFSCILTVVSCAQLEVDSGVSAEDAVQNTLLGEGITVTNITLSGDGNQVGTFECIDCNVGLGSGVILGSGNVDLAEGPNNSGTSSSGGGNFGATDSDLQILNPGLNFNDAAVLEFDFEATGDSIKFNFVWASEEYPEYANSSFNDSFGFFVSGPGFNGPYSNDAENIAIIPGTTLPVTINNLNNGNSGTGGPCEYCEYYIHNPTGGDETTIQYDGFTTVLSAQAEVQCGETYHIKIAVADAGDTGYDSAVFLEEGSFTSNQIEVVLEMLDIAQDDSTLYEGCGQANLIFTRPPGTLEEQSFSIDVFGDAINGVDFPEIPDELTFAEGETELIWPFNAFDDGILEGQEQVTFSYTNFDECSLTGETTEFTFYIGEPDPIELTYDEPTINCDETAFLDVTVSGGFGVYEGSWSNGPTGFQQVVGPDETTIYVLTVSDTCTVEPVVEEITVTIPDYPEIVVDIGPDQELYCMDDLFVSSTVEGGYGDYFYIWLVGETAAGSGTSLEWVTDDETTITLQVTDECGAAGTDEMEVTFPAVEISVDAGPDQDVTCIDITDLTAIVDGGIGTLNYLWTVSGNEVGNNPTYSVQTSDEISIQIEVIDQCENSATDLVVLSVPDVPVSVDLGPDQNVTCLDVPILDADVSGGVGNYSYTWIFEEEEIGDDSEVQVEVSGPQTYTLVVEDECGNSASDEINMAIPPVPISVELGEDLWVTCVDVTNLDPNVSGGVGQYSYYWQVEGEEYGDNTEINVTVEEDSQAVVVVEDECGNVGADEITLQMLETPIDVNITQDTAICLGKSVQLVGQADGGAGVLTYYWTTTQDFGQSISVTPEETETFELFVYDQCGNSNYNWTTVGVEEVVANFDFDYVGEYGLQLINNSVNGYNFMWQFDTGETSFFENPYHNFNDVFPHEIQLFVQGELGCVDSISDWYYPFMELYIPNSFTPNYDGVNDFFKVEGHDIFTYDIWIFNRWGELVFHSSSIDDVWDGSMMGGDHLVPDDVYQYYVKAVGVRENGIEQSGTITLIR